MVFSPFFVNFDFSNWCQCLLYLHNFKFASHNCILNLVKPFSFQSLTFPWPFNFKNCPKVFQSPGILIICHKNIKILLHSVFVPWNIALDNTELAEFWCRSTLARVGDLGVKLVERNLSVLFDWSSGSQYGDVSVYSSALHRNFKFKVRPSSPNLH